MGKFEFIQENFSLLWQQERFFLLLGLSILVINLLWLFWHLFYGAVQVCNLKEGNTYVHVANLWIERQRGTLILHIPDEVVRCSFTTRYKIRTGRLFARLHGDEPLCIHFAKEYQICLSLQQEMVAKNYVAS